MAHEHALYRETEDWNNVKRPQIKENKTDKMYCYYIYVVIVSKLRKLQLNFVGSMFYSEHDIN